MPSVTIEKPNKKVRKVTLVGGIPKRPTGTDCKSVDLSLHRFESYFPHTIALMQNFFLILQGEKIWTRPDLYGSSSPRYQSKDQILRGRAAEMISSRKITSGSSSVGRAAAFQAAGRGFEPRLPLFAFARKHKSLSRRSSGVEYFLGKEGVRGSNPLVGSFRLN